MIKLSDNITHEYNFTSAIVSRLCREGNSNFGYRRLYEFMKPEVRDNHYHIIQVPKKSGGSREVSTPFGELKYIQTCIAEMLTDAYEPEPGVQGFARGKSVITNALGYLCDDYILNINIRNFFPSITDKMVLDALVISEMGIKVPQMISALCTWTEQRTDDLPEQVLPQGAPTSPILSDIVCQTMDRRLNGLAIRFGLKYSRYADDITFSSQYSVYLNDSDFWQELKCIFDWRGFSINENKTHLLKSCSR